MLLCSSYSAAVHRGHSCRHRICGGIVLGKSKFQAPLDGYCDVQVPDVRLKEYRRLMESHVPMYAHLEIGIALGLEAGQQQPEAAGPATAMDDTGERQHVCSQSVI